MEQFLSDIIITIIGSVIGILGSLYIFRIQIRHDKNQEGESATKEDLQNCRYFSNSISQIIKISEEQAIGIKELVEKIRANPQNQNATMKINAKFEISRFVNNNEMHKFYHSYLSLTKNEKDSIVEFSNIKKSIDSLYILFIQLLEGFEKSRDFDYERRKEHSKIYEHIKTSLVKICDKSQSNATIKRFADELFIPLLIKHEKEFIKFENRSNISFIQNEFIEPLKNYVIQNKLYDIDFSFFDFADLLRQITLMHSDINEQNLHQALLLENDYNLIFKILSGLNENSKKLFALNSSLTN